MTSLAVAPLSDGRLQLFALDARNWASVKPTLLTTWKLTNDSNSAWAAWTVFQPPGW